MAARKRSKRRKKPRLLRFYEQRAGLVLPSLYVARRDRTHLFGEERLIDLPQDGIHRLPLSDLKRKWFLCGASQFTVYGYQSDVLYENITRKIIEGDRDLLRYFDPEYVAKLDPKLLAPVLRNTFGVARHNEMAERWVITCRYMVDRGYDDPVVLIERAGSVDAFLEEHSLVRRRRRKDFDGLGVFGFSGKTLSLYVMFCKEQGWCRDIKDAFPVDMWVTRISWQTRMIRGYGDKDLWTNDELEAVLRPKISAYCHEHGLPVEVVSGAIWRLGASLCVSGPRCHWQLCPIEQYCEGFVRGALDHDVGVRKIGRKMLPRHRDRGFDFGGTEPS